MVPNGKLPLLSDVVMVACLGPTPQDAPLSSAIPLDSLQGPPLFGGVDGRGHVIHLLSPNLFISKLAERCLLLLYLPASCQDQPWCLSYDHPIFSFWFCFFVDLEEHFFLESNFVWVKSLNGPFYPDIQVLVNCKSIPTLEPLYLLFPLLELCSPDLQWLCMAYGPGLNSNATSTEACFDCPIEY